MAEHKETLNPLIKNLSQEIDEALKLFHRSTEEMELDCNEMDVSPVTLIEQCVAICNERRSPIIEPIRTIHHLACTGGTLISKCIAAMPNVQFISEVDPFSRLSNNSNIPQFAPTDVIQLMRQSTRGSDDDLIVKLFQNDIEVIYSELVNRGQRLVLRDHSHSHFCVGENIVDRPLFRDIIHSKFPVISVVTVRDPIDSYLSLKANRWVHFSPACFDEYCNRYIEFIRFYADVPVIKYEDFVENPFEVMKRICCVLDISYNSDFINLFDVINLTGDSGRKGVRVGKRARRSVDSIFLVEVNNSKKYGELCDMLSYSCI